MAETTSELITTIQHDRHRLGDAVDHLRRSLMHTQQVAQTAARIARIVIPVAIVALNAVAIFGVRALMRWSLKRLALR